MMTDADHLRDAVVGKRYAERRAVLGLRARNSRSAGRADWIGRCATARGVGSNRDEHAGKSQPGRARENPGWSHRRTSARAGRCLPGRPRNPVWSARLRWLRTLAFHASKQGSSSRQTTMKHRKRSAGIGRNECGLLAKIRAGICSCMVQQCGIGAVLHDRSAALTVSRNRRIPVANFRIILRCFRTR
jgi:hypothetical protein